MRVILIGLIATALVVMAAFAIGTGTRRVTEMPGEGQCECGCSAECRCGMPCCNHRKDNPIMCERTAHAHSGSLCVQTGCCKR